MASDPGSAPHDMEVTPLQAPSRKRQAAPLDPSDSDGPVSMDHDRLNDGNDSSLNQGQGGVKSILRTEGNTKRRGLQWNEQNLQQNEEEKVPRMKIDEPPTPYHHYESDSDVGPLTPTTPRSPFQVATASGMTEVSSEQILNEALRRREVQEQQAVVDEAKMAVVSFGSKSASLQDVSTELAAAHDEADEDDEDTKRKHAEFQRLRKAHYHMEVIPKGALRAASSIDEEDDEDDDEDDGGVEDQSGMAANDGDDEYDDDGDDDNAAGDGDIETPRTGITAPAPSPRRPDVHMAQ